MSDNVRVLHAKSAQDLILEDKPYTHFFRSLLLDAKKRRASDIHIEPTSSEVIFRLRVDGKLYRQKSIALIHKDIFFFELKRLLGLSIAKYGIPQDARASYPKWNFDVRVNLTPTIFGDKFVLRILDKGNNFSIERIPFSLKAKTVLLESLKCKNGVILISGATGSGKTTTLYSLLQHLNQVHRNITTIEDPVEYTFMGLNQIEVTKDLTFSKALRAVLRQDPDVILVGEIRDEETAKLCFQAANTGHLVLSTVHANDSEQAVKRVETLGVESDQIENLLRLSMNQRLVNTLCSNCALSTAEKTKERNNHGCEACENGYSGRAPICEIKAFTKNPERMNCSLQESINHLVLNGLIDQRDHLDA